MVSIFRYASQAISWQEVARTAAAVGIYLQPKLTLPIVLGVGLMHVPKYYYNYVAAHKEDPHIKKFLELLKKTGIERQTVVTLSLRELCQEVEKVLQDKHLIQPVRTLFSHLFKGRLANYHKVPADNGIAFELFLYSPTEWRFPCRPVKLYLPRKVFLHLSKDGKITFPKEELAPYEEPILKSIKKWRFNWSQIVPNGSIYEICDAHNKKRLMSDLLFEQLIR